MARYFFHTREGDQVDEDLEGIELPDVAAAKREATLAAREMVAELVLTGQPIDGKRFEIVDFTGIIIAKVPFMSVIE